MDQCHRLTVDARAGQQTRVRGKPGSVRQLEVDVGLSDDTAWSTASDHETWGGGQGRSQEFVSEGTKVWVPSSVGSIQGQSPE